MTVHITSISKCLRVIIYISLFSPSEKPTEAISIGNGETPQVISWTKRPDFLLEMFNCIIDFIYFK